MLRDETIRRVIQFRDDRDWRQFHTPKDLAISLSLEAAELLEVFQWSGTDLACRDRLDRIREELADVLSYCVLMADVCGLDLDEILNEKVDKNTAKYPVEKARGMPPNTRSWTDHLQLPTAPHGAVRGDFFRGTRFSPERTNFLPEFWKTLWQMQLSIPYLVWYDNNTH